MGTAEADPAEVLRYVIKQPLASTAKAIRSGITLVDRNINSRDRW